MPWKRWMLAILCDLRLETYIDENAKPPVATDPTKPTTEESTALKKWRDEDVKARTRIELAIGDSEMIHIIRAQSASQMWKQLTLVKEWRGKLWKLQEELHLMGSLV